MNQHGRNENKILRGWDEKLLTVQGKYKYYDKFLFFFLHNLFIRSVLQCLDPSVEASIQVLKVGICRCDDFGIGFFQQGLGRDKSEGAKSGDYGARFTTSNFSV